MLASNLLWSVILFFFQPVLIIGIAYAWHNRNKRVKYSRKQFRVNFNRSQFELKDFLTKGLIPGLIISVISLGLGVPITIYWYLIYQVVAIVLLLIAGSRFIHPIFTFSVSSIVIYVLEYLDIQFNLSKIGAVFSEEIFTLNYQTKAFTSVMINTLLLSALILFISLYSLNKNNENKIFPVLGQSKRGKAIAQYTNKSLWVLPMAVVVPGEVIEPFANWWPLLSIGNEKYAVLILPILVGLHFTISTQLLNEAAEKLQTEFRMLSLLALASFIVSYFYPSLTIWLVGILVIIGLIILYRHRKRENLWNFRYGPADEGLRVIAVRPDSPAERLNLSIGDVIMNINDQKMEDKITFDEVIAYNRSYIKMRIRRKDGEIVIAETPLYDDDYNNLGLLIL